MADTPEKQRRRAQKRFAKLWRRLDRDAPPLRPGVAEAELALLETVVGAPVPASLRASWLVHDGQEPTSPGLWAGYRWFSVQEAIADRPHHAHLLPFAERGDSRLAVLLAPAGSHKAGVVLCDGEFFAEDFGALTPDPDGP